MLIFFGFLQTFLMIRVVNSLSGISMVKYNVPFAYLVTRTPVYTAGTDDQFNLNDVVVKNCGKHMCFVSFYDNKTMFQLISDVANNCTTTPHCLSFTAASFNYSVVFMNTTNNACSRNVTAFLNEKFKMPICPNGWYSWTRPTGKLWCYMISKEESQTWNTTESYCRNTYNASLNGFQTIEERNSFVQTTQSLLLSVGWMMIGAVKPCEVSSCDKSVKFVWQNHVSTNDTIANDNFYEPYFDGSGNCLAIMLQNGQYDDISCTQQTTFSCGKWADIYA